MSIDASLRPLRAEDSERLLEWRNRPEVARWMYTDHVISPEEHARWFPAALNSPDRRYWIVEHDGRPVGLTNLTRLSLTEGEADLGYYIADPATRGLGLGLFAQYAAVEAAFGDLGLETLFSEVLTDNAPSRGLLERLGFQQVEVLEARALKAGRPVDVLRFRLRARDWRTARDNARQSLRARGYAL